MHTHPPFNTNNKATGEELARAHTPDYIRQVDGLYRPGETRREVDGRETGEAAPMLGDAILISGDVREAFDLG